MPVVGFGAIAILIAEERARNQLGKKTISLWFVVGDPKILRAKAEPYLLARLGG